MNIAHRALMATLIAVPSGGALAQTVSPPPLIIACEGPNMPAQCPPGSGAPRTMDTARQELATHQPAAFQWQSMISTRQQFRRDLDQNQHDAYMRQLQANEPNPFLRPPNFAATAQVVNGIVTGNPK